MKRIISGLIAVCLSSQLIIAEDFNSSLSEDNLEKAYMLGAFHALEQQQRNFKVQGLGKDKIEFNKYIVALDITALPTYKLMIYQQIGYSESLTPVIINDKYLVFASYERKADAVYLQDKVLNSFHFKNKNEKTIIIENDNPNSWFKSAFVQKELFDTLMNEANKKVKGKVYVVKEDNTELDKKLDALDNFEKKQNIIPQVPIKTNAIAYKTPIVVMENKKPTTVIEKPKADVVKKDEPKLQKFKLKYKTQFFKYSGKEEVLSDDKLLPTKTVSPYLESKDYRFATSKMTSSGLEYIKLYDFNLWVLKDDVQVLQ